MKRRPSPRRATGRAGPALALFVVWTLGLGACRRAPPPASTQPPTSFSSSTKTSSADIDWKRWAAPAAPGGNLIANGGFEEGMAPWFAPVGGAWRPGEVVSSLAHQGTRSLRAFLRGKAGDRQELRWGALYEVGTVPFPRYASLWYRVDAWQAADVPQYLLFAVMLGGGKTSYQVRYFLAGAERIPYNEAGNVRFVLVHDGPPALGRWVRFTTDLHRDFRERWGRLPQRFEWLRFAVEARFDTRGKPLGSDVAAEVHFDDVYVGDTLPDEPASVAGERQGVSGPRP